MILGLTLVPLILGSLLASLAIVWFLSAKNDLLFECEKGVLESQKILVEAENTLLKMNSPIRTLVTQKRILQKAQLLARTPVELALIKAKLATLELQLSLFKQKQLLLITTANLRASRQLVATAQGLKQIFYKLQNQWGADLLASSHSPAAQIQLQKVTIDPSASLYEAPEQMSTQQTLTVTAKLSGRSLFPRWLAFLHEGHFQWQESCSSRPQKKETHLWIAQIGRGRL